MNTNGNGEAEVVVKDVGSDNNPMEVIVEGRAKISKSSAVFYNKAQEFNRDLR